MLGLFQFIFVFIKDMFETHSICVTIFEAFLIYQTINQKDI